jgi:cadmium resistance protein CadD (predicted permease)
MVEEERRPLLPLIVAAVLFCLLLWLVFFLKGEANELTAEAFSGNYLGFLFLINVNIILVMVFGSLWSRTSLSWFLIAAGDLSVLDFAPVW